MQQGMHHIARWAYTHECDTDKSSIAVAKLSVGSSASGDSGEAGAAPPSVLLRRYSNTFKSSKASTASRFIQCYSTTRSSSRNDCHKYRSTPCLSFSQETKPRMSFTLKFARMPPESFTTGQPLQLRRQ